MPDPTPTHPSTLQRITAILNALAVIAAEFGPLFIHSVEGMAFLNAATGIIHNITQSDTPTN